VVKSQLESNSEFNDILNFIQDYQIIDVVPETKMKNNLLIYEPLLNSLDQVYTTYAFKKSLQHYNRGDEYMVEVGDSFQ
jgi:hypothetical protein